MTHAVSPILMGEYNDSDAEQIMLECHDTGQKRDECLAVAFHEIHRIDGAENGERELIISTLKYFQLHISVTSPETGALLFHRDGSRRIATPVYEDGSVVDAVSATLEPPLLAAAGACPPRAVVEGGCATFRLRLTVLSSLCGKRSFAIRVTAEKDPHALCVTTAPTKTITKLRRTPREGSAAALAAKREISEALDTANKRASLGLNVTELGGKDETFSCSLAELNDCCALSEREAEETMVRAQPQETAATLGANSLEDLWEEVSANGCRLLELQAQQRRLFRELRSLKGLDAHGAAAMPLATGQALVS